MPDSDTIYIVTGLPRSGTSMVMRMLHAGGIALLSDHVRPPDVHNPHGYFEYAPVRRIRADASWLSAARGKAVKMVVPLPRLLPPRYNYAGVFIRRPLEEVLLSQRRMLGQERAGDAALQGMLAHELNETLGWMGVQPNWRVLCLDYRAVLREAEAAALRLSEFIGGLDAVAMARAVDAALYRSRSSPVGHS